MLFYLRIVLLFTGFLIPFNSFSQTADSSIRTENPGISGKTEAVPVIQETARYKPHLVAMLPSAIQETSGLLLLNGQLWTINDSDNKPEICQVDSADGSILRTVVVSNAVKTDWESITQDDSNVYIGDFGNNAGSRTDLHILKILKTDLLKLADDAVKAAFIHFVYPDQASFATSYNSTNFDCEAFFFHNDSLHLFSKNWSDLQTKHYVLPADTGNYTARLAESFNADGLITDAGINSTGNIVLLGYKKTKGRNYRCFAWLISGYKGAGFFCGDKRRIELGSALHLGQAEGIVLKDDHTGWISAEAILLGSMHKPAKLFGFDFGGFVGDMSGR